MTDTDSIDWLIDRYSRRPGPLTQLITLACRLPPRWDAKQEAAFRDRVVRVGTAMLDVVQDATVTDKAAKFRERFNADDAEVVKAAVVYLIFLTLPDYDWPEPVEWDADAGRPRINDLDGMLRHAEALVLELLAIRLRQARDDG